jgi:ABC-2 type transport system permease protein
MRLSKAWIVSQKDMSVIRKNKYIFYSLIAMPLVFGIVMPVIFVFILNTEVSSPAVTSAELLTTASLFANMSAMYLVVIAAVLPSIIASYSFVGEKIEKSLEPLLATPTTDGELLLGKSLAAFVPCIGMTYLAAAISTPIISYWSITNLGVLLIPNPYWVLVLFVITPLACILSIEGNIIVSSRVNDIRAAQQIGGLIVVPLIILVIVGTESAQLSVLLAILVSVILAVADVALFFLSKATFQREEILTKWK